MKHSIKIEQVPQWVFYKVPLMVFYMKFFMV